MARQRERERERERERQREREKCYHAPLGAASSFGGGGMRAGDRREREREREREKCYIGVAPSWGHTPGKQARNVICRLQFRMLGVVRCFDKQP